MYSPIVGLINVRRYVCHTKIDDAGQRVISKISPQGEGTEASVRMTSLISVNARATPVRGPVRYWSRQHELRLLLSFLDEGQGRPLRLQQEPFRSSAGHIQRFVSECLGLGLLTGTTEALFRWRADRTTIANFDALPTSLVPRYGGRGTRPDLLFRLPSGDLAGEARGRSSPPPKSPRKDQRNKLQKLLSWSALHDDHPFVMSWASATEAGVTVDFFEYGLERGLRKKEPSTAVERREPGQVVPEERGLPTLPVDLDGKEVVPQRPSEVPPDDFPPEDLAWEAAERIKTVEEELFDSAPVLPRGEDELFGRQLRGAWAALDLFGDTRLYFFLGLLNARMSESEADSLAQSRAQRGTAQVGDEGAPIQAEVTGRLVTAITRRPYDGPPPLRDVRDLLQ
jgi:hypothetical protein